MENSFIFTRFSFIIIVGKKMNNDMEFSFLQSIQFYVLPTAGEYFYFASCHWKVIKLDKDIFMYFFFFFCGNKELSLAEQHNNS